MAGQAPKAGGMGVVLLLIAISVVYFFNSRENEVNKPQDGKERAAQKDQVVIDEVLTGAGVTKEAPTDEVVEGKDEVDEGVIRQIVAKREELDQTVWSDEVTAQKYEEPFIGLWDKMRSSKDQMNELADFTFEDLTLGMPGEPTRHDHGIDAFLCDNGTQTFDPAQWKKWLSEWKDSGLRIVQSEWHHSRFEPSEESPRSDVSFVLDLANDSEQAFYNVRGKLVVHWKPLSTPASRPEARSIEATDVKILKRQAAPIFEEAATMKVNTKARLLLIANDIDGDGLSELISPVENALYWNRGDFQFEQDSLFEVPPPPGLGFSGVMADFTGDGRADFLGAGSNGIVFLYPADENGRFTARAKPIFSAKDIREPTVLTAGDIDADGDLDVWIGQYRQPYSGGQMPTPYFDANDGHPAYLLRNDGDGAFEDITEWSGLTEKRNRRTYSASLADVDHDSDLDLVVVSDFSGIDVYTNDGTGKFTDITDERLSDRHAFGMSLSFGDYNLDSKLDFFMTGMSSTTAKRLHQMGLGQEEFEDYQSNRPEMGYGNRMYLADGQDFNQATFNDQVARTGWSWGSTSFDFNNDGYRDLFVANGHNSQKTAKDYCTSFWCHDIYTGSSKTDPKLRDFFEMNRKLNFSDQGISWNGFEHNVLLMNEGGQGFLRIDFLAGVSSEHDSRNVISDDFNGDGHVDLVIRSREPVNRTWSIHVLENKDDSDGNWIGVNLEGTSRSGLGAKVTVKTPSQTHVAPIVAGDSFVSQHAPVVHFGLGAETKVEEIEIQWPDGAVVKIPSPETNRYHRIESADIKEAKAAEDSES
ncbi:CRTAC1 family protein [Symmachiella dynata]|uniref:CRTAC1 family protein n=1 Tax=Symmachiella dynata TaxID=2527995 RepID=UPI0030EF12F1